MNNLEQQLLSLLDALRRDGDLDTVRSGVTALADVVRTLDDADPVQRGLRGLFEYLDVTTEDAVAGGAAWLAPGRLAVEDALRSALSDNRRGGSVLALSCVRDELESLAACIVAMRRTDRTPLHGLLAYVDMKNRQSLGLAITRDWGEPGPVRRLQMGGTGQSGGRGRYSAGRGFGSASESERDELERA